MKNLILISTIIFLLISACNQKVNLEAEKAEVKNVVDQITGVLKTEDMQTLSQITAHDDDIIIFGTDAEERMVGWKELRELMEKQFEASETREIIVKDQVIKLHDSGKVAWFSERINWELEAEGDTLKFEGVRITGVLEKRDEGWVYVQLHYSMPQEGQALQY